MKHTQALAFCIIVASGICVFISSLQLQPFQQYALLSHSFTKGHLYFTLPYQNIMGLWQDATPYGGNHYWPLGILPGVLLMPLALIETFVGNSINIQGILNCIFVCIAAYAVFRLVRNIGYNKEDSVWWSIAFCMASMFVGVAMISSSWFIAGTIATSFLLLSLAEFTGKKRYWLIGIYMGLGFLTRSTIAPGILFFMTEIFLQKNTPIKAKLFSCLRLVAPFTSAIVVYFIYNFLRFHSLFETGYAGQILIEESLNIARSKGLFSLRHLPFNLYYMFINGPKFTSTTPFATADTWGMSIFLTSPWLLSVFFIKNIFKKNLTLWLTTFLIAIPILLYYGNGYAQFGSRYALDFLPFIFLALLISYKKEKGVLSTRMKVLFCLNIVLNLYLLSPALCFLVFVPVVVMLRASGLPFLNLGSRNMKKIDNML